MPESYGNFDLVKKFKLDYADILVSKWQSRSTGLIVVHLDYDGIQRSSFSFSKKSLYGLTSQLRSSMVTS